MFVERGAPTVMCLSEEEVYLARRDAELHKSWMRGIHFKRYSKFTHYNFGRVHKYFI